MIKRQTLPQCLYFLSVRLGERQRGGERVREIHRERSQGDRFITQQAPTNHPLLPARNNWHCDQQEWEGAITALQKPQSGKGGLFGRVHLLFTCWQQHYRLHDHRHGPRLFQCIHSQAPIPLSDHNQITLFFKQNNITHTKPNKLYNIPRTYIWLPYNTEQYQEGSNSEEIQLLLKEFI